MMVVEAPMAKIKAYRHTDIGGTSRDNINEEMLRHFPDGHTSGQEGIARKLIA